MSALQVMSLIDSVAMTQLLRLVRECNVMSSQKGAEVTDMDTEGSRDMDHTAQQQLSAVILGNLSKLLQSHGFSGQTEILNALIDVLGEVARSTYASGRLPVAYSTHNVQCKLISKYDKAIPPCAQAGWQLPLTQFCWSCCSPFMASSGRQLQRCCATSCLACWASLSRGQRPQMTAAPHRSAVQQPSARTSLLLPRVPSGVVIAHYAGEPSPACAG